MNVATNIATDILFGYIFKLRYSFTASYRMHKKHNFWLHELPEKIYFSMP